MNSIHEEAAGRLDRGFSRRRLLTGAVALAGTGAVAVAWSGSASADTTLQPIPTEFVPAVSAGARQKTLIGIGYETWWVPGSGVTWDLREATPKLGTYRSDDPAVIKQHAEWIRGAGYDFILVDWSNNLTGDNWTNGVAQAIMTATDAVFATYSTLAVHPKISLLIGTDANDTTDTVNFQAQISRIKSQYLGNPSYQGLLQQYQGKPLLTIYRGPNGNPPPDYTDPDFTVRFMTALHETIGDDSGQWSWIDRAPLISGPVTALSAFGEGVTSGGEPKNSGAAPAMTAGTTLGQSFTFSGSELTKVTALLATYASSDSSVTMTLYAGTPDTSLTQVASTTLTDFPDNSHQSLSFAGQPAGTYYLELSNPSGTPSWWFYSGSDVVDVGGQRYVDRVAQAAGTVMTFSYEGTSASGSGGLNGWQVGAGWSLVANGTGKLPLSAPEGMYPSTFGATAPGSLISPPFTISGTFLSFYAAGQDGPGNTGDQNYFTVRDASTGAVLRRSHTPNTTMYFAPTLIDVRDLAGRSVVFQADNGNASDSGWMAFASLAQAGAEFSVAAVGIFGDNQPAALSGWDVYSARSRLSGATLTAFMQAMFVYQPEVMLVQQWNEFGPSDENNVSQSNDIEPTVVTELSGAQSDGWGGYYLNLVTELITQYRKGAAFPAVTLDSRYP